MERLKDEASTNLYIEGLPLQIDEPVCIHDYSLCSVINPFLSANLDPGCLGGPQHDQK